MPKVIEDFIFYYYAKLVIAPSAGFAQNYRFIIHTYKKLKSADILMSSYERELLDLANTQGRCAFCGTTHGTFQLVHVVPRSYGVQPGMNNIVYACEECANSKDDKDLVKWWCQELGKARDELPRIPIGLYLKIAYELHKITFSLKKRCNSLGDLFALLRQEL